MIPYVRYETIQDVFPDKSTIKNPLIPCWKRGVYNPNRVYHLWDIVSIQQEIYPFDTKHYLAIGKEVAGSPLTDTIGWREVSLVYQDDFRLIPDSNKLRQSLINCIQPHLNTNGFVRCGASYLRICANGIIEGISVPRVRNRGLPIVHIYVDLLYRFFSENHIDHIWHDYKIGNLSLTSIEDFCGKEYGTPRADNTTYSLLLRNEKTLEQVESEISGILTNEIMPFLNGIQSISQVCIFHDWESFPHLWSTPFNWRHQDCTHKKCIDEYAMYMRDYNRGYAYYTKKLDELFRMQQAEGGWYTRKEYEAELKTCQRICLNHDDAALISHLNHNLSLSYNAMNRYSKSLAHTYPMHGIHFPL